MKPFQKDSMDGYLRNSLWNGLELCIQPSLHHEWQAKRGWSREGLSAELLVALWVDFYKWPLSTLPIGADVALNHVRTWFFDVQQSPWNRVYDFIEFVAGLRGGLAEETGLFVSYCNRVLERESSAYRFIGKLIGPITNEVEIKAIVEAASLDASLLAPASKHIATALKLLSDRLKPDYRNSMKESISAVEAVCKVIAKNDKATLGPALDAVTAKVKLHSKLQEAFKALYSYTSDTHGIRHALKDDATPDAEDAKFMLVSCSAFVNYLVEKASKKGLLPK